MKALKLFLLLWLSVGVPNSALPESLTAPSNEREILCTVAIAGEFGYRLEDVRSFAGAARGCVELSRAEKYGAMDAISQQCLPPLQRAREAMNGKHIAVDEQAVTDMCLHTIRAQSSGEINPAGDTIYIDEVKGNAIARYAFCKGRGMSGQQCVLFYEQLAGGSR
jgi:hypothetical protein